MASRDYEEDSFGGIVKKVMFGAFLLFGVLFALSGMSSIDSGHVGVVKHFGAVQPYILQEGVNFTRPWPFADVTEVDATTGKSEYEAAAASKDLQAVHTKIAVQWSIAGGMAPRLIQRFGSQSGAWTEGIVAPAVQEVVKAVSARYTAEQLITQRAQVKTEIEVAMKDFIKHTLKERDCSGAIRIANVAVTNFEFSADFNQAIEAKVKAEQQALKAVNEKTKRITEAEADYQEKKLAAEAQAYTTEIESKARADTIKRESDALSANPNLIQLRIAEKWNGVLPTMTGTGAIPMLNVK